MLPIQVREGAAAPVTGTDESGRVQQFHQPRLAFGMPEAISSPIQSLINSSAKLEQGQVPDTKDVMPFLLAAASPSLGSEGDAALSAGARFRVLEGGKKAIPVVKGEAEAADETPKSLGFLLAHKEPGREQYDYRVIGKKEPPQEGSFGMQVNTPFQSQAEALAALKKMKSSGEASDIMVLPAEMMQRYLQKGGRLDQFLKAEKSSGLINRPNITPGSIAAEHQLDMATNDRLAAEGAANSLPKDVRPSQENLANIIDANFTHGGRVTSSKMVPIDELSGGVGPAANDLKRVRALADQMKGSDGYFERIVVDQHGNVIEGQHRLDAAKLNGYKQIPVTVLHDNAAGFDTDAMMAAVKNMGLHPSQQNKIVEHALDTLHRTGSQQEALEYEVPGFDEAFQAAIRAATPKDTK